MFKTDIPLHNNEESKALLKRAFTISPFESFIVNQLLEQWLYLCRTSFRLFQKSVEPLVLYISTALVSFVSLSTVEKHLPYFSMFMKVIVQKCLFLSIVYQYLLWLINTKHLFISHNISVSDDIFVKFDLSFRNIFNRLSLTSIALNIAFLLHICFTLHLLNYFHY